MDQKTQGTISAKHLSTEIEVSIHMAYDLLRKWNHKAADIPDQNG